MSAHRAVTFDFHNTLADCDRWFELEIRELVAEYLRWRAALTGETVNEETLAAARAGYRALRVEIMDHGNEETAERCVELVLAGMDEPVDPASIAEGLHVLMTGALETSQAAPGAVETVRALAEAGYSIGIVSSAVYHPFLEWSLAKFGIRDAFTDVTTSASARLYKGRPELYWSAARRLGVEPRELVHIGDSFKWDVAGALAAGLTPVWLHNRPDAEPDGIHEPALTITTLSGSAPAILDLLASAPVRRG